MEWAGARASLNRYFWARPSASGHMPFKEVSSPRALQNDTSHSSLTG